MSKTASLDPLVSADTFRRAILSDLSSQYDAEQPDLIERGAAYVEANPQSPEVWMGVNDAVSRFTRDLRNAGYYPETVLAVVKPALRQAAASLIVRELAVDDMIREAAQACIAAYFDLSRRDLNAMSRRRPAVAIPKGASTPGSNSLNMRAGRTH